MNHDYVERNQIVDLYLMGRLEPEEEARFEEHYLECGDCIERLELAEGFQAGLKQVAAEDLARAVVVQRVGVFAWLARVAASRRAGLLAAAMLAIVVLPLGFLYQRERDANADLEARLATSLAPQGNVPIVALGTLRGEPDPTGPVDRIRRPETPRWMVLSLELSDADLESYSATLRHREAGEVWRGDGLVPGRDGALALSLHSSFLVPGDYVVEVEGLPASGGSLPVGRYSFRVLP